MNTLKLTLAAFACLLASCATQSPDYAANTMFFANMYEAEALEDRQSATALQGVNPEYAQKVRTMAGEKSELASALRLSAQQDGALLPLCSHIQALHDVADYDDQMGDTAAGLGPDMKQQADRYRNIAVMLRDDANECQELESHPTATRPTVTSCTSTLFGGVQCIQHN